MKIDRGNWKIESISGTWYVLITNTKYNEERAVSSRGLSSVDALHAMSEDEFERAARAAFLGWDIQKKPVSLSRSKHAAAGIFFLCAAFAVWVGLFILD